MNKDNRTNEWLPRLIIYSILLIPVLWIVPYYVKAMAGGKYTGCQSNLMELGTALKMYAADNDSLFPSKLSKVVPKYLKVLPTCPAARKETYSDSYRVSYDRKIYTFYCNGENHKAIGISKGNYPQYNSLEGLRGRP